MELHFSYNALGASYAPDDMVLRTSVWGPRESHVAVRLPSSLATNSLPKTTLNPRLTYPVVN